MTFQNAHLAVGSCINSHEGEDYSKETNSDKQTLPLGLNVSRYVRTTCLETASRRKRQSSATPLLEPTITKGHLTPPPQPSPPRPPPPPPPTLQT